jgi:hypothetical protein
MNWCHREPTLDEILSDSIVRAVMEVDGAASGSSWESLAQGSVSMNDPGGRQISSSRGV